MIRDKFPYSLHPVYSKLTTEINKYRLTYEGGRRFVDKYLEKYSNKEKTEDFTFRKKLTYAPGCACAAINEIKDAIFQRIYDVNRSSETPTYIDAISGKNQGVDLAGSEMNTYIGEKILPELLISGRIGVLVDAPENLGQTLHDKQGKSPYLIYFKTENILNWYPNEPVNGYEIILLKETEDVFDDFGLYQKVATRYRLYKKESDGIHVTIYDEKYGVVNTYVLKLDKIPFHIFEISHSLMHRVADKEIALMNIESSDLMFCLIANFPMFYEQSSAVEEQLLNELIKQEDGETNEETKTAEIGLVKGRRYPKDVTMAPGFINPDPEVLRVSIEKGTQIKEDIRLSVNLNLLSLNPRRSSAESKKMDLSTLEASLSYIGLILEKGENQIGKMWDMFEGKTNTTKISYPLTYDLRSEEDRRIEAQDLIKLRDNLQNKTYKQEMTKRIAEILLGRRVGREKMSQIFEEIDQQTIFPPSPDVVVKAYEHYAITAESAAVSLGYSEEEGQKARDQRVENASMIAEAQGNEMGSSRGTPEIDEGEGDGEKRNKPKRGENE